MNDHHYSLNQEFLTPEELAVGQEFLRDGYKIFSVQDKKVLLSMRSHLVRFVAQFLGEKDPHNHDEFLNLIHELVDTDKINDLRLFVFEKFNSLPWVKEAYLRCARQFIECIVGNELVMQRKINLSIQMPFDQSSVLPVHADTWSGDSPYEVVLWIPFVNVSKTKSMFVLPVDKNDEILKRLENKKITNTQQIMEEIRPHVEWLDVKFGEAVLFTQNIMHGNVMNEEISSRWSMNCRFKSAFSPYADKKLGEFFEPITLRPATLLGARYKFPSFSG